MSGATCVVYSIGHHFLHQMTAPTIFSAARGVSAPAGYLARSVALVKTYGFIE
jgi:hypothetical protein